MRDYLRVAQHASVLICAVMSSATLTLGATKTWDGGGGDNLASTAANWDPDGAPVSGDDVVFDGRTGPARNPCTWDLDVPVASWDQQSGYTGAVTVTTVYGAGFDTLHITGNCAINGGVWRHADNSTAETYRLCVKIGGTLTLAAGAAISADSLGYDPNAGPSPGGCGGDYNDQGASHGGMGGVGNPQGSTPFANGLTYGSVIVPVNLGSGGCNGGNGGGAVCLVVGGAATVNGPVRANGGVSNGNSGGAGGSVLLKALSLSGSGSIAANGADQPTYGAGGGGRVAVVLTGGSSLGSVTLSARGGVSARISSNGAAGSVYTETAAQNNGRGVVTIDNNNAGNIVDTVTTSLGAMTGPFTDNLDSVSVVIRNGARVRCTQDDLVKGIDLAAGTVLYLRGYTMTSMGLTVAGAAQTPGTYTSANFPSSLSGTGSIIVAGNGMITINDRNGWWNAAVVPVSLFSIFTNGMRITTDTASNPSWVAYATSSSIDISAGGQGVRRVWAQFRDAGNTPHAWVYDSTIYDTEPPTAALSTSGGYTAGTWPNIVTGTASDPGGSGVDTVKVEVRDPGGQYFTGGGWSASQQWVRANGVANWSQSLAGSLLTVVGTYPVRVRVIDKAGNSDTVAGSFIYDTVPPPTGTVAINDRNGFTNSAAAALTLSATNAAQMRIALSPDTTLGWVTYSTSGSVNLGSGEGGRRVYAQFRSATGTVSAWVSDSTTCDVTPPGSAISFAADTFKQSTWPGVVAGTASDALSGIDSVQIQVRHPDGTYLGTGGWTASAVWVAAGVAGTTWSYYLVVSTLSGDGVYTVRSRAIDRAGNVQTAATVDSFVYDNMPVPSVTGVTPLDTIVLTGSDAAFRVTTNTPAVSYAWFKAGFSDTLSTTSTLSIIDAQTADSGARYRCVVWNAKGQDSSGLVQLRVVETVHALFGQSATEGRDSLTVSFSDSSTGSIRRRLWYFGDGATLVDSTGRAVVTHTYTSIGEFTCMLVVVGEGPAGVDTATSVRILVYQASGNPLRVSARYVSCTRINVTVRYIDSVNTAFPPPLADSIGLWLWTSPVPDTSRASVVQRWRISDLAADSQMVTVTVPAPASPADTVYEFWACPFWNSGVNAYNPYNSVKVVMRPALSFGLTARYLGNRLALPAVDLDTAALDSALVEVTRPEVIDTPLVSLIVMSYGFGTAQASVRDTFTAAEFLSGVTATRRPWGISNPAFVGDTQRVYVACVAVGANRLVSAPVDTSMLVGWPKPANSLSLVADSSSASQVYLHWSPSPAGFDSVRILYAAAPDTIPRGAVDEGDVGGVYTVAVPASTAATSMAIGGLESATTYHFGIQVKKNLQWSDMTILSRATAATESFDPLDSVDNTITIDSLWFDAATNLVNVRWSVVLIPTATLDVKITCSTDSQLVMSPAASPQVSVKTVSGTPASGETTLDPGVLLAFGTKYYVGLWLRSTRGPWALPTPASLDTLRTPQYAWQVVRYFATDTVRAFNDRVLVRKADGYPAIPPTIDTVRVYAPDSLPDGFVQVGPGFTLQRDAPAAVEIGLAYDSIPPGAAAGNLGIYTDSAGVLLVNYAGLRIDLVNHIVWIRTADFVDASGDPRPYLLLADLLPPEIVIAAADTGDTAIAGEDLADSIAIGDNAGNVAWKLLFAKDEEAFVEDASHSAAGIVCGCCGSGETVAITIPGRSVTEATGVRALFIVTDGAHTDTINISRRAVRTASDAVTTVEQEWVPLSATAVLDSPDVPQALRTLAPDGGTWAYDNREFRIYHWEPSADNAAADDRWMEYSAAADSVFSFVPMRVYWVKTRTVRAVNLGRGVTLSLKGPASVLLPAGQWTDIALPFQFDAVLADILDATGGAADSLEFYTWVRKQYQENGTTVEAQASELMYSILFNDPGVSRRDTVLPYLSRSAYTVYNSLRQDILLKVPPMPVSMSPNRAGTPKTRSAAGWSLKVVSRVDDGPELAPVYCSFGTGPAAVRYLPRSPSFLPYGAGVLDRASSTVFGHCAVLQRRGDGWSWDLAFCNESDRTVTFRVRVEKSANAPQGVLPRILAKAGTAFEPEQEWLPVSVAPHSRAVRQIAAGAPGYLDECLLRARSLKLALTGCYPNPSCGAVRIGYTLPAGADIAALKFLLYDMQGRLVWSARRDRDLASGAGGIVWDGRTRHGGALPPGLYALCMIARDGNGAVAGVFRTRLLRAGR